MMSAGPGGAPRSALAKLPGAAEAKQTAEAAAAAIQSIAIL
jgi:hypothetical protein